MKTFIKSVAQAIFLILQTAFLLFLFVVLLSFLGGFFPELSMIEPPGACGISDPFILLITLTALFFTFFAWFFASTVPCICAALWVAELSGYIAFIDNNTGLRDSTPGQIFEPVVICAFFVVLILLGSSWIGRWLRKKRFLKLFRSVEVVSGSS